MTHDSQRALEVERDLFVAIDFALDRVQPRPRVRFRLDASEAILSRTDAQKWVRECVDEGFPHVVFEITTLSNDEALVTLAAYEDPDSQFHI